MSFTEPTDQPPRWLAFALHPPTWLVDIALAGFLTLIVLGPGDKRDHVATVGPALLACATVALVWRRRLPLPVFALACGAYLADGLMAHNLGPGQPTIAVATYTVVQSVSRRAAAAAAALAAAVIVIVQVVEGTPLVRAGGALVFLAGAAVLGFTLAERRRERARERELLAARAAAEERVRLARELHDIVAHHLSVIVLQANVLADTLGEQSGAHAPARAILDSGREALTEIRRVLQVLRTREMPASGSLPGAAPSGAAANDLRAPQPGLADLGALVERVSAAGLTVRVETEGEPRELPAAVDLSAYRILQEALTNVLRHAQASMATVGIRYTPQAVELEVVDDGVGPPTGEALAAGHGLTGMQERAALFGGELKWGPARPASGRGYKLQAVLPL